MPTPIASFNFKATGLVVKFEDLSQNVPTSWAWDFGDPSSGGSNSSNLQNPEHTFSAAGEYKVVLTASNVSGSNPFQFKLIVSESAIINVTIAQLVKDEYPSSLILSEISLSQLIRKWQLYLLPMVEVSASDVFNEYAWPPLVNVLISKLVLRDLILEDARKAVAQTGGSAGTGQGSLKALESGPSKAEWYDTSDFFNTIFAGRGGQSFMTNLHSDICMMAKSQQIYLAEICNQLVKKPLFIVGKKPKGC